MSRTLQTKEIEQAKKQYERVMEAIESQTFGSQKRFFEPLKKDKVYATILYNFKQGVQKTLPLRLFDSIEKQYPNINIDYIKYGKGELLKERNVEAIPCFSMDQAMRFDFDELIDLEEQYNMVIPPLQDCSFATPVFGEGLAEDFSSGQLVSVKRINGREFFAFGQAHLIQTTEYKFLKYLHKSNKKDYIEVSSSKEPGGRDSIEIPIKEIKSLFIVRGTSVFNAM